MTDFKIESVTINREIDNVCCSNYAEVNGAMTPERLGAYHKGSFWHIGIYAEAVVSYSINDQGDRRLQTFTSGGLWGIENDSDATYIEEIEKNELEDLKQHLAVFGISVSGNLKIMSGCL